MAELAELAQGRTCLYVAHRLSTVRGCDRIVVLSDGLVAEEGSHEQLLQKRGLYAQMWARQSEGGADGGGEGGMRSADGRTRDEEAEGLEAGGGSEAVAAVAAAVAAASEGQAAVAALPALLHAGRD